MENITGSRGVLGLAGPASRDILSRLTGACLDNDAFPWLSAQSISVAGKGVMAMRVSYTGELGWELHHDLDDEVALYDALKGVAGVAPPVDFGFYAMNSMRMEKAYRAWGGELTVENTAWELGLDRFVVLGGRDFIGREALVEQQRSGVGCRLFFAEVDTVDTDIIGGEAVFREGERVGVAISGSYGHRVGRNLAFLLLPSDTARRDGSLVVEVLGRMCPAILVNEPAYDPENRLARG